MINITQQGDQTTTYLVSYTADYETDITDLPIQGIAVGSTCFVIETSNVYMLGSDKIWHMI